MGIIDEIANPKFSFSQDGATATRTARGTWSDWPSTVLGLMGTPVFFNGVFMLVGRQQYPGIPTLWVQSVEVEGMGKTRQSTFSQGWDCEFARFTISYGVNKDEDDKDENGDPATYLIEELNYGVDIVQVPVKVVDQQDLAKLQKNADDLWEEQVKAAPSSDAEGNPVPLPVKPIVNPEAVTKTLKKYIRIPTITYKVTIPRLFELPNQAIQACVGRVNRTKIFGGPAETVLFDGPSAGRESAFFTQRFWRIDYQFIYQPFGWNNILHPDTLKWVPAKAVGCDNNPYENNEFRRLFPKPYQVRK